MILACSGSRSLSPSLALARAFSCLLWRRLRGCSAQLVWVLALYTVSLSHTLSSHSCASHNSTWLIQLVSGPLCHSSLCPTLCSALLVSSFCLLLSVSFSSSILLLVAQDIRISFHFSFSFCALAGKTTSKSRLKSMHNKLNLTLLLLPDPCHTKKDSLFNALLSSARKERKTVCKEKRDK